MPHPVAGIHHVTAICSSPQVNVDFYVETLGLRLVKRTVNFDDPEMHHLYYGDEAGRPGTILTFFPIPGARTGHLGAGMATATAFSVAPGSIDYWLDRLAHLAHEFLEVRERFGERVLPLHDPDGLRLELVERAEAASHPGWEKGRVEPEHRLRTLDGVTLAVPGREASASLLRDVLGYREEGDQAGRLRMRAPGARAGSVIDLLEVDTPARGGTGTVHHVALRARDDDEQRELGEAVRAHGIQVTDVRDRHYFRSIYFREPGGVLFEIATDRPGFAVDEDERSLGSDLRLPPWLEPRRAEIGRRLDEIAVPE